MWPYFIFIFDSQNITNTKHKLITTIIDVFNYKYIFQIRNFFFWLYKNSEQPHKIKKDIRKKTLTISNSLLQTNPNISQSQEYS